MPAGLPAAPLSVGPAATRFTAGVSTADVHQGLGAGNPDLIRQASRVETRAVQPSVGSDIDRYHGLADGNDDLFNLRLSDSTGGGESPPIDAGAEGNPDLGF